MAALRICGCRFARHAQPPPDRPFFDAAITWAKPYRKRVKIAFHAYKNCNQKFPKRPFFANGLFNRSAVSSSTSEKWARKLVFGFLALRVKPLCNSGEIWHYRVNP